MYFAIYLYFSHPLLNVCHYSFALMSGLSSIQNHIIWLPNVVQI